VLVLGPVAAVSDRRTDVSLDNATVRDRCYNNAAIIRAFPSFAFIRVIRGLFV